MNPSNTDKAEGHVPVSQRLASLDALRGFDMFWIIGGDSIGHALSNLEGGPLLGMVATQLNHVAWEGFRFYDLIFPLFVFIVGVSLVFSLSRLIQTQGRAAAVKKVVVRSLVLYVLGLIYYGGINPSVDDLRLMGVLQRIAIAYFFAGLLFIAFRPRALAFWCAGILIGYWLLMAFVPVPGVGAGNYAEGMNLANYIDKQYLPFFKWDGDHDPEGLLSNIPAVATCLLGVFAGMLMRDSKTGSKKKLQYLLVGGIACLAAGYLWGLGFPVIKKIWTSSYVLVAGGWSALLLAAFYWIIDVQQWKKWSLPFIWIGMNPLTIYLLSNVIQFDALAARFVGGPIEHAFNQAVTGLGEVVVSLAGMGLAILVCWFLYRRKIFIRI